MPRTRESADAYGHHVAVVGGLFTALAVSAGVLLAYRSRRREFDATGQGPGRSAQVFFLVLVGVIGVGLLVFNVILR